MPSFHTMEPLFRGSRGNGLSFREERLGLALAIRSARVGQCPFTEWLRELADF